MKVKILPLVGAVISIAAGVATIIIAIIKLGS
jgi:hypothetical protein